MAKDLKKFRIIVVYTLYDNMLPYLIVTSAKNILLNIKLHEIKCF